MSRREDWSTSIDELCAPCARRGPRASPRRGRVRARGLVSQAELRETARCWGPSRTRLRAGGAPCAGGVCTRARCAGRRVASRTAPASCGPATHGPASAISSAGPPRRRQRPGVGQHGARERSPAGRAPLPPAQRSSRRRRLPAGHGRRHAQADRAEHAEKTRFASFLKRFSASRARRDMQLSGARLRGVLQRRARRKVV